VASKQATTNYHRSAIETMLEGGFQPTRTVVIASGFDEEVGGLRVSYYISVLGT